MRLVEREIEILAPPPAVYRWLTEPERFAEWIGAQPGAVVEPHHGGRLWWRHLNGDSCSGFFVEVAPFSRVSFTYGWEQAEVGVPPGSTLVEITLQDLGGRTLLRLLHRGLSDEASHAHEGGWTYYLGRLAAAASGADPGPDTLSSSSRVPRGLDSWPDGGEGAFRRLSEALLDTPSVNRSTMMGLPCLRADGRFFASFDRRTGDLVVKLDAGRVGDVLASGVGHEFAPAGRTFREWIAVTQDERERWLGLMAEARLLAATAPKTPKERGRT